MRRGRNSGKEGSKRYRIWEGWGKDLDEESGRKEGSVGGNFREDWRRENKCRNDSEESVGRRIKERNEI